MLPRVTAIFLSLFLHGAIGLAMWPRLQQQELEVLDFGTGQDIELAPQGIVAGYVTNRGDDVQSLDVQDVIPVNQRQPAPQRTATAQPEQLHDVLGDPERKSTQEAIAVEEQKPTQQPAADAPAKQLHDVIDGAERESTQQIAAIQEEKPIPEAQADAPQEQLHDVLGDAEKNSTQEVATLQEQRPTQQPSIVTSSEPPQPVIDAVENKITQQAVALQEQMPAPQRPSVSPANQLQDVVAAEESLVEHDSAKATATEWPDQRLEPTSGKPGELAPPDELKEATAAQLEAPSPPETIEEEEPDVAKVQVQPEQVVIVTERSSGAMKTGGEARLVGIYLGKINERVQQSKVNPQTRLTGTVVLRYRVGIDGSLLSKEVTSSSGSRVLDDAAVAALDRAAPFPPIPAEVSRKPMTFLQPFKFIVR